jgi:hypothetical protein
MLVDVTRDNFAFFSCNYICAVIVWQKQMTQLVEALESILSLDEDYFWPTLHSLSYIIKGIPEN